MKDFFFTFGGKQFWEDLFVCHGWRIQRNSTSRKTRLLDDWNILRCEGSYRKCLECFKLYAQTYQLKIPQNQTLVVMLHGFGQSSATFKPLENLLHKKGIITAAVNYPSLERGVSGHAKQLNLFLNNLYYAQNIVFITYGCSNIILEKALSSKSAWQDRLSVKHIIEIDPLIQKNKFLFLLSQVPLLKFILGKMASEMSAPKIAKLHHIPQAEISVFISQRPLWKKILALLFKSYITRYSAKTIRQWCGAAKIHRLQTQDKTTLQSLRLYNYITHITSDN